MRRRPQTRGGTSVVSRDTHGTPGTLCSSVEVVGWVGCVMKGGGVYAVCGGVKGGGVYAVCGGVKGGVCMQCVEVKGGVCVCSVWWGEGVKGGGVCMQCVVG